MTDVLTRRPSRRAPDERGRIHPGWRIFQIIGLLAAVSYIIGWATTNPGSRLDAMRADVSSLDAWTGLVTFLSPIVGLAMIVLALEPRAFRFMTERSRAGRIAGVLLLLLTAGWFLNALLNTPMYDKLLNTPMSQSKVLPITGGVFLHMVFQHWFMSAAVFVLALAPSVFAPLIRSPRPAGLQCAVISC